MTPIVAYLGIKGAYSEQAARQCFDTITDYPCGSFAQIVEALTAGSADYGILPIENSLAGTVAGAYEVLTEQQGIYIVGEVILHIVHALLAPPGTTLDQIREVRSHPQALSQCAGFLRQHGWKPVEWYNTAGSARDLAADPVPGVAAIADRAAAQLYGLAVLAESIQDLPQNYTRFLVLGRETAARAERNKTSVLFTTRHQPGALADCLTTLAQHHINLTKIESRPLRERPWEYLFYIDFEGHVEDDAVRTALESLGAFTTMLRVLGSYPAAG